MGRTRRCSKIYSESERHLLWLLLSIAFILHLLVIFGYLHILYTQQPSSLKQSRQVLYGVMLGHDFHEVFKAWASAASRAVRQEGWQLARTCTAAATAAAAAFFLLDSFFGFTGIVS